MNIKLPIRPNEKPLDKNALDELILYSGFKIDMLLEYSKEEGAYHVFALYPNNLIRQVYTQRNAPRKFKDVGRGVKWGKRMGFRHASVYVDYSIFPDAEDDQ